MKKTLLLLITILAIYSCDNDNDDTTGSNAPKLTSCLAQYFFSDFEENSSTIYPNSDTKSYYVYSGDKVIKSTGGFLPLPAGLGKIFNSTMYDSISHKENSITIYTKMPPMMKGSILEKYLKIFNLDAQGRVSKISINEGYYQDKILKYTYSKNTITETDNEGVPIRRFYFEKNNLVRILYASNTINYKEILFQDYDDKPNPFKKLFYLRGAFIRSLSENNFRKVTINEYRIKMDDTYGIAGYYYQSLPIEYNSDGYPMFGDYEDK